MQDKYKNRAAAGKTLAKKLQTYANQANTLVLALPRGGVPVGYEIAAALHLPLDVFVVRKLGVPGHDELAMGAIAMGGACVLNTSIIEDLTITVQQIEEEIAKEEDELKRREIAYRGNLPFPSLQAKTIILVDDGIATGATIRAAIKALRQLEVKKIIVAVPVVDKHLGKDLEKEVEEFICPLTPPHFYAVGAWFVDFRQTEDEEVRRLLRDRNLDKLH